MFMARIGCDFGISHASASVCYAKGVETKVKLSEEQKVCNIATLFWWRMSFRKWFQFFWWRMSFRKWKLRFACIYVGTPSSSGGGFPAESGSSNLRASTRAMVSHLNVAGPS